MYKLIKRETHFILVLLYSFQVFMDKFIQTCPIKVFVDGA